MTAMAWFPLNTALDPQNMLWAVVFCAPLEVIVFPVTSVKVVDPFVPSMCMRRTTLAKYGSDQPPEEEELDELEVGLLVVVTADRKALEIEAPTSCVEPVEVARRSAILCVETVVPE